MIMLFLLNKDFSGVFTKIFNHQKIQHQPGDLEVEEDTLILLSGIQNIDLNISQEIQKLLTTRKYIDPFGRSRIFLVVFG